jgi:tagaturonate epimerase
MSWREFHQLLPKAGTSVLQNIQAQAEQDWDNYGVYPSSLHVLEEAWLYIIKEAAGKKLVITGGAGLLDAFQGEFDHQLDKTKVCPLSAENAVILRKKFPFTAPIPLGQFPTITIGLGDRLGLASPGHLKLLKQYPQVRPVLAQQSIRELNLTGRNYQQVLDAATWAVFQEDYRAGFGADGDHLKTDTEVQMALDYGFTMITLDCSEQIDNAVPDLSSSELSARYRSLPADIRQHYEQTYLNQEFTAGGLMIHFGEPELMQTVLIYHRAIEHAVRIGREVIADRRVDFELSIDETATPTTPQAHFLVAHEIKQAGVMINSLAPRFCGEFQKGIDYRGDLAAFERDFKQHEAIATTFDYKLSVHSGSDKFKVFPIIGRFAAGKYHLKTAGTNWLEALRAVAGSEPQLFREIFAFALQHLSEAKQYYHISADPARVPALDTLKDRELLDLLSRDDARQILHITYGSILQALDRQGASLFKERLFSFLAEHEEQYYQNLIRHIGKHLTELGIQPGD